MTLLILLILLWPLIGLIAAIGFGFAASRKTDMWVA